MSCVEASVNAGRKCQIEGEVLDDRKLPEVPVVFVEGASKSLSQVKPQVRQILMARYPAGFEESSAATPEEMASNEEHAGDLEGESDWDLADLTGGLA